MELNYRIHCLNTMKVYFDLRETMEQSQTVEEQKRNRRTLQVIEKVFYNYTGCNTQVSYLFDSIQ